MTADRELVTVGEFIANSAEQAVAERFYGQPVRLPRRRDNPGPTLSPHPCNLARGRGSTSLARICEGAPMSSLTKLTLPMLTDAVAGGAVAIRAVSRLVPAGGLTDKVFPPTYVKEKQSVTKYAMETRKVQGQDVQTVLLDSVASQANRIEEALLEGWRRGELQMPVISVDFTQVEELADLAEITSLQAPHRVADALLRDSIDEHGTPFRQTIVGQRCTDARPNSCDRNVPVLSDRISLRSLGFHGP